MKRKMSLTVHHSPAKIGPETLSMQVLITMILRLVRNITKQHPKVYKPVKHVQN